MSLDATPIELWIEWRQRPRAAVVVPYVRAADDALIDYEVQIGRKGGSGAVEVRQSGDTRLQADVPRALGEVLIEREPGDTCTVFLRIKPRGTPPPKPVERSFACPRAR